MAAAFSASSAGEPSYPRRIAASLSSARPVRPRGLSRGIVRPGGMRCPGSSAVAGWRARRGFPPPGRTGRPG